LNEEERTIGIQQIKGGVDEAEGRLLWYLRPFTLIIIPTIIVQYTCSELLTLRK